MGLRIATDVGALSALRNLRRTSARLNTTFERLSTGRRINRASDNPSGLILLQQLRADLSSIQQATENTQSARNLVNVADAALSQVSDRLISLRSNFVAALNTGALGEGAQQALQTAVNATLSAVDRIGATTRFGDQAILNGSLGFSVTNASSELQDISVEGGDFPGGFPFNVQVDVASAASQAQAGGTLAATQSGDVTFRITGPRGAADITVSSGATATNVADAINARTDSTGVEATPAGEIRTVDVGFAATLNLQNIEGDLDGITAGFSTGTDIVANVNGAESTGRGNTILVNNGFQAEVTVAGGATGSFSFDLGGGGATFQLGPTAGGANDISVGIEGISVSTLGNSSGEGTLRELATGGESSISNDPGQGLQIIDAALREVSSQRARLGSVAAQVFEPNIDALDVAFENLSSARSRLEDADIAEEISNLVRDQVLRESGIAVLRQIQVSASLALRLLA